MTGPSLTVPCDVLVALPPDIWIRLAALCLIEGCSVEAIVADAVALHLDEIDGPVPQEVDHVS